MDEGGRGENTRAFGTGCAKQKPGDGIGVNRLARRDNNSNDLTAAVARPGRACGMVGDDVAVAIEQRGSGHGNTPIGSVPGIDLHADSKAMEMHLVACLDSDLRWNYGRTVVI